jgi:hypothetical protein
VVLENGDASIHFTEGNTSLRSLSDRISGVWKVILGNELYKVSGTDSNFMTLRRVSIEHC